MKTIIITIATTLFLTILLLVGVPYLLGYKIFYSTNVKYDFDAISAFGQWLSALIPIALVPLSVYVTNKFDKTKNDIRNQNLATIEYVDEMIKKAEANAPKDSDSGTLPEEEKRRILMDKAYRYVSIAGFTKTEEVAKHLAVSKEQAFELLLELLRVDKKITAGGRTTKENLDNVIWLKK